VDYFDLYILSSVCVTFRL